MHPVCNCVSWIHYRPGGENSRMAVSWSSEVLAELLLFSSSRGIEEDAGYLFSHITAKVYSYKRSCALLFFLIKLQIVGLWVALYECWVGEIYHKSTVLSSRPWTNFSSPLVMYLQLCTCIIHLPVACCFAPCFLFVPPSHWFWEQPGLPHISQAAFRS